MEFVSEDFDGGGFVDVQALFDNAALDLAPGAERVAITGRTRSGVPAAGTDTIVIVPNDEPVVTEGS